jgi:hypothetical protein
MLTLIVRPLIGRLINAIVDDQTSLQWVLVRVLRLNHGNATFRQLHIRFPLFYDLSPQNWNILVVSISLDHSRVCNWEWLIESGMGDPTSRKASGHISIQHFEADKTELKSPLSLIRRL